MSGIPRIESKYSEGYRRVNVSGVLGGVLPGGIEAVIYSEERRIEDVVETQPVSPNRMSIARTVEVALVIDPMQAKSIHQWLGQQIADYERIFGRIPSPEEIESRSRRAPGA